MRALIAEANDDYRNFIRLLLEKKDFEVIAVANGHDALEAISNLVIAGEDPPLVAFIGLEMPGIGGAEVLKRIRQFPGDVKHTYVIMMANEIMPPAVDEAIAMGADDFISTKLASKLLEIKLNAAKRFATLFEQRHRFGTSIASAVVW